MDEKIEKYFNLISDSKLADWFDILETKKALIKSIFEKLAAEDVTIRYGMEIDCIFEGIRNGLNEEQILLYAASEFSPSQRSLIKEALEEGIPVETLKPIANEKLCGRIMQECRQKYYREKHDLERKKLMELIFS